MDKETKLSDQSIRLNEQGRVEKLFDLEDDAEYELTFYMKGENVSKGSKNGAQVLLCGGDRRAWARAATNQKGTPEYGTFDWKKGSRRFAGKYFKSNKVYIMLTLNGSGTVWFDRIELKKLGSLKPKALKSWIWNGKVAIHSSPRTTWVVCIKWSSTAWAKW